MNKPATRPDRGPEMDAFLARIGKGGAARRMLAGDASFRRYERVEHAGEISVLMDAPPPWEDVRPFVKVSDRLAASGVSVPVILGADEAEGFLLLEDLGDALYSRVLREAPAREGELYRTAVDALVAIVHDGQPQGDLPPYDMAVYLREVALLVEWFLPQVMGIEAAAALREGYLQAWRGVLEATPLKQNTLVHRDYHADNLLWLHDRAGHRAVGMLDYQDALWGDAAYDLVSLLEDARRDVGADTVAQCYAHFVQQLGEDETDFAQRYAVLGAQRNAKIIGIFARLCVRDGKPHYLDYLPRVWGHFLQDLKHPVLAPIAAFIDAHVPAQWRGSFTPNMQLGGIVL